MPEGSEPRCLWSFLINQLSWAFAPANIPLFYYSALNASYDLQIGDAIVLSTRIIYIHYEGSHRPCSSSQV
ncbi:hypothetical protein FOXYSP1_14652 [Fusarium oxysporum f. sp. phaseoli]